MVNEFIALRPSAFQHCSTNFELLSEMQHYGLSTRLLDFTFNQLIALYFACEKNNNDDSRVVMNAAYINNEMGNLAEAICSFYKHGSVDNIGLEEIVPFDMFKSYFNQIYINSDDPNQIIVQPK